MSTVDYATVAAGLNQAIPFNVHLGLETITVADDHGVVRLPDEQQLRNHVGSQHAGGLFAAGEAASGAAFVGAFLDIMGEITPLAESAQIAYKKLAKGEITATARFTEDREELRAKLNADGRVRFPVEVQMTNAEGTVVAEMTVNWYVRRNDAATKQADAPQS
jgi:acyl-coenzyme A thioesterase PaaI-like protein